MSHFKKSSKKLSIAAWSMLVVSAMSVVIPSGTHAGTEIAEITVDTVAPIVTELKDEYILERGLSLPAITITGTDETEMGSLFFSVYGPDPVTPTISLDNQEVAIIGGPLLTYDWRVADIFTAETGLINLSTVELGDYQIDYYVKDKAGNQSEVYTTTFKLRPTAPGLNPVISPTKEKTQLITGQKEVGTAIYLNDIEIIPADDLFIWQYLTNLEEGENILGFTAKKGDYASPKTTATIVSKSIAPPAVTNVSAVINATNQIVLSWINPDPATYDGLKIVRFHNNSSAVLGTYPKNTSSFLDINVSLGNTYGYDILVFDSVGNETGIVPVSVTILQPSVQATTFATSPIPSKLIASAPLSDSEEESVEEEKQEEVKAKESESNEEKSKDTELPFWGLVLLMLLASVGVYLFITQKPITSAEPVKPLKRVTAKPVKKVTPAKKSLKKK